MDGDFCGNTDKKKYMNEKKVKKSPKKITH